MRPVPGPMEQSNQRWSTGFLNPFIAVASTEAIRENSKTGMCCPRKSTGRLLPDATIRTGVALTKSQPTSSSRSGMIRGGWRARRGKRRSWMDGWIDSRCEMEESFVANRERGLVAGTGSRLAHVGRPRQPLCAVWPSLVCGAAAENPPSLWWVSSNSVCCARESRRARPVLRQLWTEASAAVAVHSHVCLDLSRFPFM